MESQYYNLAEKEFSKAGKILVWCFGAMFFISGVFILLRSLILKNIDVSPELSIVPFGVSLAVWTFASYATIKRTDLYFSITNDKLEFRYGIIAPKLRSFNWSHIDELIVPSQQKKIMLVLKDKTFFIINLTWIEKKKSDNIIKHIYQLAREKNLKIEKVKTLSKKL
jgi:hypothetical protein